MARGGAREGAGRKPGKKDKKVRIRQKIPVPKQQKDIDKAIEVYDKSAKPLFLQISRYISKKNRKLYKDLLTEHKTPLESLKALRDDLLVRYNASRIAELEGIETLKNIALAELKELEEKGTINQKKVTDKEKTKKVKNLQKQLNEGPRISTAVTSLATEIRQTNELIDRIESDRQDLTLNIFNILQGNGDKKQTEALRNRIFDMPKDVSDGKIIK